MEASFRNDIIAGGQLNKETIVYCYSCIELPAINFDVCFNRWQKLDKKGNKFSTTSIKTVDLWLTGKTVIETDE